MLYINGEWQQARSGKTVPVKNPATGEVIQEVAYGGEQETRQAIASAKEAFAGWKEKTGKERGAYLDRIAENMRKAQDAIAETMTLEMGKPLSEAKGEVAIAIDYVDWYAEEAKRVYGDLIPASEENKRLMVFREPVGVVGAITPWNFPVAMITRKVAPALAAGCTFVLKPALETPLSAIKVMECFHEAGLPKGAANLVIGAAAEIGAEFTRNPDVRKITFTGSTEVGKKLIRASADTVKKVSMELGGHAPFIVFADADLDAAVEGVMATKFRNCGQTCISTNRIYVEEGVADEFGEKLARRVASLTIGDGMQEGTDVGPLINEAALAKVQAHIDDAVQKDGKILCGGRPATVEGLSGNFFEPTVINYASDDMQIAREETFGPVAPIFTFNSEEDLMKKVNHPEYGLAAYFYTKDLDRAFRTMSKLEYGIIGVNDPRPIVAQAPFGGVKESGIGREGGKSGIVEFLEEKFVSIRMG